MVVVDFTMAALCFIVMNPYGISLPVVFHFLVWAIVRIVQCACLYRLEVSKVPKCGR